MPDKVYDSPKGWVAQHINDYVKSNGKKGYIWRGVPTLLLTTRGRKTGNLRRTALEHPHGCHRVHPHHPAPPHRR
ncbi:hypothetical protein BH18ACT6_BH18ACT6_09550 [soil metagenome]